MSVSGTLEVVDAAGSLSFSFDDLMRYHGSNSPGGVAHAFKVMERGFALLSPAGPPERRKITLETAFGGPGARDGFELVTRAVTGDRFVVDASLARPERGRARERFVFKLAYGDQTVTLLLREGYVSEEFIDLARKPDLSDEEDARLDQLKDEMAERVMGSAADEVYDVE
ncbi:MAG: hypothetical protein QOG15_1666 [Solirubrobacteraceae bacterium]|nr:hypothetical protein [Solirubrobacteraceae bacterium]